MLQSRLIFVEGIMGSGKSTTARWLARLLRRNGIPAYAVPEALPHPTIVFRTLPHWKQPWRDMTADTLIAQSVRNWQAFVTRSITQPSIVVFDGQLFHGDVTALLLMGCPLPTLQEYVLSLVCLLQPLHPHLIYFYQDNVAQALDVIGTKRGADWVASQVAWKVTSPYAQQHGWHGIDGWKHLYLQYRQLTDAWVVQLPSPP